MDTKISTIISDLTQIQDKVGDIHVRIMGEPIAGVSVRKIKICYGDHVEEIYDANLVGRAFDGTLWDCEKTYRELKPIKQVEDIIKKSL